MAVRNRTEHKESESVNEKIRERERKQEQSSGSCSPSLAACSSLYQGLRGPAELYPECLIITMLNLY